MIFALAASPALSFFLLAAAGLGNAVLLAFCINWLYSHVFPRKLMKLCRMLSALYIVTSPFALLWYYGLTLPDTWDLHDPEPWRAALSAYILLCWVLGLGVFPLITAYRLLRRPPEALLADHTQTVDVAAALGYRPVGTGKYRALARLPRNEVFQVDFTEKTFRVPRLPAAWDGLTVLHLSDLHFNGTPDKAFFKYVIDLCREQEPDLVAVTGDIVDSHKHHRWVVPILGRLRWKAGGYAILGNHDSWHDPNLVRRRLRKAHLRVLGNGWDEVEVRGQRLVVIGNETPWFGPAPDLSACPAGTFRLCLSHTPDTIPWARARAIDLVLAGHVHGGQVRFPLVGSVFVPSRFSRRYDCGVFHEPPTLMHVSRGLGGREPLRYNCRPEVTRLVLRVPEPVKATSAAELTTSVS